MLYKVFQEKRILSVALSILGIALLLIAGYFLFQQARPMLFVPSVIKEGTTFRVVEQGISNYYTFSYNRLLVNPPKRGEDGLLLLESVPSPLNSEEMIALASAPWLSGVALGIVKKDGSFTELLTGGTAKADLLVTPEGVAVVSVRRSVELAEPNVASESAEAEGSSSEADETGSADGPVALSDIDISVERIPASTLYSVNIINGEVRSLGEGRSPRLVPSGDILAVSDEGLVHIDVYSGTRTVFIAYPNADNKYGTLSQTGTYIAMGKLLENTIDFYQYEAEGVSYLGSLTPEEELMTITLLDNEKVLVRYTRERSSIYELPTPESPFAKLLLTLQLNTQEL